VQCWPLEVLPEHAGLLFPSVAGSPEYVILTNPVGGDWEWFTAAVACVTISQPPAQPQLSVAYRLSSQAFCVAEGAARGGFAGVTKNTLQLLAASIDLDARRGDRRDRAALAVAIIDAKREEPNPSPSERTSLAQQPRARKTMLVAWS
jgi:hypothetical protein